MEIRYPGSEPCLTEDERHELLERWQVFQAALKPLGAMIEGPEELDCDNLYTTFVQLGDEFEAFEHAIMSCKQVRLLQASRGDTAT